jgi:hypothetical protein
MNHRRKGDPSVAPIAVTLEDGAVLRCSVASIGREQQPRWVLMDQDGVQYMGPEVATDKSPEAVQRLIADWWKERLAASSDTTE